MKRLFMAFVCVAWFVGLGAQNAILRGPMLDAHNCYPEDGKWNDRITRALGTKHTQIGIEQDLVWKPDGHGGGVSVVGHESTLTGTEPTLEDYFFKTAAPIVETRSAAALARALSAASQPKCLLPPGQIRAR